MRVPRLVAAKRRPSPSSSATFVSIQVGSIAAFRVAYLV